MDWLTKSSTNQSADPDLNKSDTNDVLTDGSVNSSTGYQSSRPPLRTISTHSLLAANVGADVRRGPHAETTRQSTERASFSRPPPLGKPSVDRRLSATLATSIRAVARQDDHIGAATSPPTSLKSLDERQPFTASSPVSTTATDNTVVTTNSTGPPYTTPILSPPLPVSAMASLEPPSVASSPSETSKSESAAFRDTAAAGRVLSVAARPSDVRSDGAIPSRAPRSGTPRSVSASRRLSRTTSRDGSVISDVPLIGRIGVCALDVKARSRPSRQILTRLQSDGDFEVIVFGDKVILDEDVEDWPDCDFLISFFSDGFPLDKAIAYWKLRKPFLVNDLHMQKVLWDRRLCLMILDQLRVPTPRRLDVTRDGGPRFESAELAKHVRMTCGVVLQGAEDGTGGGTPRTKNVELIDNGDTLVIDGESIRKPFVEKPVSGEDHNVIIYFPRSHEGGGARRLFRKVGNKSSAWDKDLITPRSITDPDGSYIYEQFLQVDNAEDVKAYTIGSQYCHAETRKSPVVDGLVRRNTHGKELRYVTKLNDAEKQMAARIAKGFGQRICGFDLLRAGQSSYVIDVNGWSFVKDNEDYYNDCARILKSIFSDHKFVKASAQPEDVSPSDTPAPSESASKRHAGPHSHRNALKTILKSPSMSRLSAHIAHPRHHDSLSSPKGNANTVSISSPPSMERNSIMVPPPPPKSVEPTEALPPPLVESDVVQLEANAQDEEAAHNAVDDTAAPLPNSKRAWKLKGVVSVIRHADRTPKQKIKFTAHSAVFVDLLKGHHEEVLLKGEAALQSVQNAVRIAMDQKLEDPEKLRNLANALYRKIGQPDTKVQIKPMFRKKKNEEKDTTNSAPVESSKVTILEDKELSHTAESSPILQSATPSSDTMGRVQTRSDSISGPTFSRFAAQENDLVIDKMQLVMKWGGEPTHSARYQSHDLGIAMRDDYKLLNRAVLSDVRMFTSSEKRVKTSAQIWAGAFIGEKDLPDEYIQVRKDLLDDSNAAKDVMDKVKKKLKHLLREGNSVPEDFAWPKDVPEPYFVMLSVVDLLKFHRRVMRYNFKKLQGNAAAASLAALSASPESLQSVPADPIDVSTIQARWCTGEDAELFKERWEKLFKEFCDNDKADPSKVSELYDTMKYDALHNKQFLEWIFTPSQTLLDEMAREESLATVDEMAEDSTQPIPHRDSSTSLASTVNDKHFLREKFGRRRRSVLAQPPSTPPLMSYEQDGSYFKLFPAGGDSKLKSDKRLGRLRELYRYAKVLFDYIGPQEYGITNDEKLEIGLLTSLPLLREIVQDLEELQASSNSASFIYFTKESHIYTLLNCIMEGGIHTKIKRATIPELDYLSQICFELYEARDSNTEETEYSIRISISPGCHTVDPLDVSLDSKHAIGSAPRRSLTNHQDWKEVISTLKAKFDTVQLPKSFLAVNVSEKHEQEARRVSEAALERGRDETVKPLEEEQGRAEVDTNGMNGTQDQV